MEKNVTGNNNILRLPIINSLFASYIFSLKSYILELKTLKNNLICFSFFIIYNLLCNIKLQSKQSIF